MWCFSVRNYHLALEFTSIDEEIGNKYLAQKGRVSMTSRSLTVLKKSEKGLLTEYQRSFSFRKKSSSTGRCFTEWKPLCSFVTDNR
jgi:hypothetical protein